MKISSIQKFILYFKNEINSKMYYFNFEKFLLLFKLVSLTNNIQVLTKKFTTVIHYQKNATQPTNGNKTFTRIYTSFSSKCVVVYWLKIAMDSI